MAQPADIGIQAETRARNLIVAFLGRAAAPQEITRLIEGREFGTIAVFVNARGLKSLSGKEIARRLSEAGLGISDILGNYRLAYATITGGIIDAIPDIAPATTKASPLSPQDQEAEALLLALGVRNHLRDDEEVATPLQRLREGDYYSSVAFFIAAYRAALNDPDLSIAAIAKQLSERAKKRPDHIDGIVADITRGPFGGLLNELTAPVLAPPIAGSEIAVGERLLEAASPQQKLSLSTVGRPTPQPKAPLVDPLIEEMESAHVPDSCQKKCRVLLEEIEKTLTGKDQAKAKKALFVFTRTYTEEFIFAAEHLKWSNAYFYAAEFKEQRKLFYQRAENKTAFALIKLHNLSLGLLYLKQRTSEWQTLDRLTKDPDTFAKLKAILQSRIPSVSIAISQPTMMDFLSPARLDVLKTLEPESINAIRKHNLPKELLYDPALRAQRKILGDFINSEGYGVLNQLTIRDKRVCYKSGSLFREQRRALNKIGEEGQNVSKEWKKDLLSLAVPRDRKKSNDRKRFWNFKRRHQEFFHLVQKAGLRFREFMAMIYAQREFNVSFIDYAADILARCQFNGVPPTRDELFRVIAVTHDVDRLDHGQKHRATFTKTVTGETQIAISVEGKRSTALYNGKFDNDGILRAACNGNAPVISPDIQPVASHKFQEVDKENSKRPKGKKHPLRHRHGKKLRYRGSTQKTQPLPRLLKRIEIFELGVPIEGNTRHAIGCMRTTTAIDGKETNPSERLFSLNKFACFADRLSPTAELSGVFRIASVAKSPSYH